MTMLLASLGNSSGSNNIASTLQQLKQQRQKAFANTLGAAIGTGTGTGGGGAGIGGSGGAGTVGSGATGMVSNATAAALVMNGGTEVNAAAAHNEKGSTHNDAAPATQTDDAAAVELEHDPEIDIVINNVVCSFSVGCHLNLRKVALKGVNVEYRRENGMVTMKLRHPYTTASIWSSGRITCTGATSERQANIAARRYARTLQKLGFGVRFRNFRVVNVLGTCSMPWAIKIVNFSERFKKEASYEPELHPGVTYKLRSPKATLKIFSTGSITVTAASVANVQAAIEHIYPLVFEFRKKRSPAELEQLRLKKEAVAKFNNTAEVDDLPDEQPSAEHSPPPKEFNHIDGKSTGAIALQRRNSNLSYQNVVSRKRKRLSTTGSDGGNEAECVDDPESYQLIEPPCDLDENIVMYTEFDDPEDLIEGPDDEYDDC